MKIWLLLGFTISAQLADAKEMLPKVLIFGKALRSAHEKIVPLAGTALVTLAKKNGFEAKFSDDPSEFTTEKLEKYGTVVFLDVSQGVLNTAQKIAFEKYFEQGGGLVAIHSSISAGRDWPWFRDLVGTLFIDHPKVQNATVQVDKSASPSMTSMPDSWSQSDEWYNYTNPISNSHHILATVDESSYQGGKMGKPHPIIWCKELGKARFFYTAMGHDASLYQNLKSEFDQQLLWAVGWTMRHGNSADR